MKWIYVLLAVCATSFAQTMTKAELEAKKAAIRERFRLQKEKDARDEFDKDKAAAAKAREGKLLNQFLCGTWLRINSIKETGVDVTPLHSRLNPSTLQSEVGEPVQGGYFIHWTPPKGAAIGDVYRVNFFAMGTFIQDGTYSLHLLVTDPEEAKAMLRDNPAASIPSILEPFKISE